MHSWLMRNLSFLAFLLMLVVLAYAALTLVFVLPGLLNTGGRFSFEEILWVGLPSLLMIGVYVLAIAIVYGLFLRFLALCDDIAAIRRQQTGKPASLDLP